MKADNSSPDRIVPDLTRRGLFRTVGLATGGAMLLGLPKFLGGWTSEAEAAGAPGLASSMRAALELDGIFVGFLDFVEGGNAFADIVPEAVGPDMIQRKRPGPVRFEDIVIGVPLLGDSKPMTNLVTEFLTNNPVARNGVIRFGDISFNEVKRLEFSNALLTEVALPTLDASNKKDEARLLLRIIPQSTRLLGGTGKKLQSSVPQGSKGRATSGNFRFNVQGLENACGRISIVGSIVARRSVAGTAVSQDKLKQSAPGVLDCSIVRITLPEADAGPFYSWFDDTVVKGKAGGERAGLLEWLDLNLNGTTVVASVQLGGLGIVRYAPEPVRGNSHEKTVGLVQVDMYCESIIVTIL